MLRIISKYCTEYKYIGILSIFVFARLGILCYRFFYELDGLYIFRGDDIGRVFNAWQWLKNLQWLPYGSYWLPLPGYLLGIVLFIFPYPTVAPNLLHMLLSTFLCVFLFFIAKGLFPSDFWAPLLSCAIVAFIPTYTEQSLATGAEIDMHFFLAGAFAFWIYRGHKNPYWAMLLFAIASMTRYESWCFVFALTCLLIWNYRSNLMRLISLVMLLWIFIGLYVWYISPSDIGITGWLVQYRNGLLSSSGTTYSQKLKDMLYRASIYPTYFWKLSPLILITSLVGLIIAWRAKLKIWQYSLVIFLAFLFFELTAIFIASAWPPQRLVVVYYIFLAPFFGYALRKISSFLRAPVFVLPILFLTYSLVNVARVPLVYYEIYPDAIQTAKTLLALKRKIEPFPNIMVEMLVLPVNERPIWEHTLFLHCFLDKYKADREKEIFAGPVDSHYLVTENNPSIFDLQPDVIKRSFDANNIKIAVVYSEKAVNKLKSFAKVASENGLYKIIVWDNQLLMMIQDITKNLNLSGNEKEKKS